MKSKNLIAERLTILIFCCFLIQPMFSRLVYAAGLPGEYLVTQRWHQLFITRSPLANPALLTEDDYIIARGAFAPILQNQFKLWELGAVVPLGLYQSAGFTWIGEDDGYVDNSMVDPVTGRMVSAGRGARNMNSFFVGSYAYNIWRGLSVGGNLTIAYQNNYGEYLKGVGFDLGATYRIIRHPMFGEHIVGIATQNLIAPNMRATWVPDADFGGKYSRDLRLSWRGSFFESLLSSDLDLDIKDFAAGASEFQNSTNLTETAKKIEWGLSWRIGGWILRMFTLDGLLGFNKDVLEYWGISAGLNLPHFNQGRDLLAAYQFALKTESMDASSHTFYVRAEIGKHREEIYARKMAKLANMKPNELYNRARTLYSDGKYWDALYVFGQIMVEYPDFFKNDWVSYYMASCEEMLDMRQAGIGQYNKTRWDYARSQVVAYSDLGLMRIHYREGDHQAVTNQFIDLNRQEVSDSIKFHATYVMGESYLREKEYQKAVQALALIPPSHPEYLFAQHTMGVAYVLMDEMENATNAFGSCIQVKAKTPSQAEIANKSLLLLGYIFYEEGTLNKAVTALRMIPKTSIFIDDVQLGLGWTAAKATQWTDCIAAGQALETSSRDACKTEGLLLQALAYVMIKDYAAALRKIEPALALSAKMKEPSKDSLEQETNHYKINREMYELLGKDVATASLSVEVAKGTGRLDSLHVIQQESKTKLDKYLKSEFEFGRQMFFARNIEDIKNDVDYMAARIKKLESSKGLQKSQEKTQELDKEIEKLKNQMENIDSGKEEQKK